MNMVSCVERVGINRILIWKEPTRYPEDAEPKRSKKIALLWQRPEFPTRQRPALSSEIEKNLTMRSRYILAYENVTNSSIADLD